MCHNNYNPQIKCCCSGEMSLTVGPSMLVWSVVIKYICLKSWVRVQQYKIFSISRFRQKKGYLHVTLFRQNNAFWCCKLLPFTHTLDIITHVEHKWFLHHVLSINHPHLLWVHHCMQQILFAWEISTGNLDSSPGDKMSNINRIRRFQNYVNNPETMEFFYLIFFYKMIYGERLLRQSQSSSPPQISGN